MPRGAKLVVAGTAAALLAALYLVFGRMLAAQRAEQVVLDAAASLDERVWAWMRPALGGKPVYYIMATAVIVLVIVAVRRCWPEGLVAAVAFIAANAATQVLKAMVFDRESVGMAWTGPNSMPSGHTTVAISCGAAILMVAAPRYRPLAATLGAAFAAYIGIGTIIGGWHRPADVVASCLVVLICFVAGSAVLPSGRGTFATVIVLVIVALGGVLLAVIALTDVWNVPTPTDRQLVVAFAGACAATIGAAAGTFAVLLAAGGRTSPDQTSSVTPAAPGYSSAR